MRMQNVVLLTIAAVIFIIAAGAYYFGDTGKEAATPASPTSTPLPVLPSEYPSN